MIPKNKKRNGMTLIEVIVATTLIAALAVGILPLFLNSITISAEVKEKQIASKFAESKIEEYRTYTYEEILNLQPDPETDPIEIFSVMPLNEGSGNVFIYDYEETEDLKKIKVEVNWKGKRGNQKNISFFTLLGEYGTSN